MVGSKEGLMVGKCVWEGIDMDVKQSMRGVVYGKDQRCWLVVRDHQWKGGRCRKYAKDKVQTIKYMKLLVGNFPNSLEKWPTQNIYRNWLKNQNKSFKTLCSWQNILI